MSVTSQTAEEFYSESLDRIHLLADASRAHALNGDGPSVIAAIADQWAADVITMQAVAWERIVVVSRTAHRSLFDLGERVLGTLLATPPEPAHTAADVVASHRRALVAAVDPALAEDVSERFAVLDHLAQLPAPSAEEYAAAAESRLGGLDERSFVQSRVAESRQAMARSREARVRGDVAAAITAAYEADMLALDAYLVGSARAWGDSALLTVYARWDLATAAIGRLGTVPDDLRGASAAVRGAITSVLGSAEGSRLAEAWESVR